MKTLGINISSIIDQLNELQNETITQVYFEEIAAGTTTGQISLGSGVSIQEGFLGKDGDILVSGLNADGFPNEETPTDNSGVKLTASFTNVTNGDWTLDTGTDNPPSYTIIFAVTGNREDVINWKNSNPQYELWFDATESVVDLTLQDVYDNSSPKELDISSDGLDIVTFNTSFSLRTSSGGNRHFSANAFGAYPRAGLFLTNEFNPFIPSLGIEKQTGQTTDLLSAIDASFQDLFKFDSEGRLNLLTDIGVPDTNDDGSLIITGGLSVTHTTSDNHTAYFLGDPSNKPVFKARHQTLATSTSSGKLFMGGYESDGFDRFAFYSSGAMGFGGGSSTRDVFIWREAVNQFGIADNAWSPTDGGASIKVYGEGLFQKSLTVDRLTGQTDNLATFNSEFGSPLVQITSDGDINSLSGDITGQNIAAFFGAQFGLSVPNFNGTARDVVSNLRMQFGDEYTSYNSPFENLGQAGRNARAAFFETNSANNSRAGIVAYSESTGNNGIKSGGYFQGRRTDDFDGSNLRLIGSWGAIDNLENKSGLFATGVLGTDTPTEIPSGGSGGSYGGYFISNQALRTTTDNVGLYATASDSGSGNFYAAQFDGTVDVSGRLILDNEQDEVNLTLKRITGQTSNLALLLDETDSALSGFNLDGRYFGGIVENSRTKFYTAAGNEWIDFSNQAQGIRLNKRPDGGSGGWFIQFRSNTGNKYMGVYGGGDDVMFRDNNNDDFLRFINPSNNGVTRIDSSVDFELTDNTTGVIMTTPDGTKRYRIQINNSGNLTTTQI